MFRLFRRNIRTIEQFVAMAIAAGEVRTDPIMVTCHRELPADDGPAAIAFSYFETLAQVGDRNRVLEEQTRLRSLNNLLNRAGFESHLYEDYVDVTLELLGELAGLVPSTAAAARVEEKFNDPDVANAVIAHIRVGRTRRSLERTIFPTSRSQADEIRNGSFSRAPG